MQRATTDEVLLCQNGDNPYHSYRNELSDPTLNFFIMTIENVRLFMYLYRVGSVKCCCTAKR